MTRHTKISAIVPAPTAWTEADAPPPSIRMAINMAIESLIALRTDVTANKAKEIIYTVLLPSFSEKADLTMCSMLTFMTILFEQHVHFPQKQLLTTTKEILTWKAYRMPLRNSQWYWWYLGYLQYP